MLEAVREFAAQPLQRLSEAMQQRDPVAQIVLGEQEGPLQVADLADVQSSICTQASFTAGSSQVGHGGSSAEQMQSSR